MTTSKRIFWDDDEKSKVANLMAALVSNDPKLSMLRALQAAQIALPEHRRRELPSWAIVSANLQPLFDAAMAKIKAQGIQGFVSELDSKTKDTQDTEEAPKAIAATAATAESSASTTAPETTSESTPAEDQAEVQTEVVSHATVEAPDTIVALSVTELSAELAPPQTEAVNGVQEAIDVAAQEPVPVDTSSELLFEQGEQGVPPFAQQAPQAAVLENAEEEVVQDVVQEFATSIVPPSLSKEDFDHEVMSLNVTPAVAVAVAETEAPAPAPAAMAAMTAPVLDVVKAAVVEEIRPLVTKALETRSQQAEQPQKIDVQIDVLKVEAAMMAALTSPQIENTLIDLFSKALESTFKRFSPQEGKVQAPADETAYEPVYASEENNRVLIAGFPNNMASSMESALKHRFEVRVWKPNQPQAMLQSLAKMCGVTVIPEEMPDEIDEFLDATGTRTLRFQGAASRLLERVEDALTS